MSIQKMSNHEIWLEDLIFNLSIKRNFHIKLVLYPMNSSHCNSSALPILPRCPRTRRKLRKQLVTGSTRRFPVPISEERVV